MIYLQNYKYFVLNQNATYEIIMENNMDLIYLSSNPNITWDIIKNNPYIHFSQGTFMENPNIISWDIVENNPEQNWNYSKLSLNPNITLDIVMNNPDKKWDYAMLYQNPSISYDFWCENTKNYRYIDMLIFGNNYSLNPNVTWEFVEEHPEIKWNYKNLFQNKMTKHPYYHYCPHKNYVLK